MEKYLFKSFTCGAFAALTYYNKWWGVGFLILMAIGNLWVAFDES